MSLPELLLSIYAVLSCLLLAARQRVAPGMWRTIAVVGATLVATTLVAGSHRLAAAPMLVIALAAAMVAARRARSLAGAAIARLGVLQSIGRVGAAVAFALIVCLDAAFIEVFDPLSNDPVRELLEESHALDFSQLPWPAAFEMLHERLSSAYAMGAWKRIEWAALHDRAVPKIAAAARAGDRAAYYLALRDYLWSAPDGHIDLSGNDAGLRKAAIRGGFGLALLRLDDGRTIVNILIEEGPAAKAGLHWGATNEGVRLA